MYLDDSSCFVYVINARLLVKCEGICVDEMGSSRNPHVDDLRCVKLRLYDVNDKSQHSSVSVVMSSAIETAIGRRNPVTVV